MAPASRWGADWRLPAGEGARREGWGDIMGCTAIDAASTPAWLSSSVSCEAPWEAPTAEAAGPSGLPPDRPKLCSWEEVPMERRIWWLPTGTGVADARPAAAAAANRAPPGAPPLLTEAESEWRRGWQAALEPGAGWWWEGREPVEWRSALSRGGPAVGSMEGSRQST